jgi:hypothetical protein
MLLPPSAVPADTSNRRGYWELKIPSHDTTNSLSALRHVTESCWDARNKTNTMYIKNTRPIEIFNYVAKKKITKRYGFKLWNYFWSYIPQLYKHIFKNDIISLKFVLAIFDWFSSVYSEVVEERPASL